MAKAKPEAKVTKEDFIASLKKHKKNLVSAAHTKGGARVEDKDIIEKYELEEDSEVTLNGKISNVGFGWAKGDKNRPYIQIFSSIDDGTSLPGIYCELSDERGAKRATRYMQALGYDTTQWEDDEIVENVVDCAEELTKKNPNVSIKLSVWGDDADRLNIDFVLQAASKSKGKAEEKGKAKGKAKVEEPEEDESELDENDFTTWVDYVVKTKIGKKVIEGTVTAHDEDDETFTVEDEDGEEHQVACNKCTLATE